MRARLSCATIQKEPKKNDWGGYGGYFTDHDDYYWGVAYGEDLEFDESNMLIIKDLSQLNDKTAKYNILKLSYI